MKYKLGSSLHSIYDTMQPQNLGDFVYQNWAYSFSQSVSNSETQEMCIKYRVLNKQTAFLALENGDTVTSTKGNNMVGNSGGWRSGIITHGKNSISIYPNPVVSNFAIESVLPIISIRILDITGRLIYFNEVSNNTNLIELNSDELNMKRGIYYIVIEDKSKITTLKIIKE